jgi:peptidoglycan DL-endopeptidase CwlO
MLRSTLTLFALLSTLTAAEPPAVHAPNATLDPSELIEFSKQPPRVQELLTQALALTKLNLTYAYGSSEPSNGGMDCSGTMYYLLRNAGFKDVPRDSSSQYAWARKAGGFRAVVSKSAKSFEFDELQPGDLLFWSGTYETSREIPISHVMLYLGTERKRKTRVMFGASDGRSYAGAQRWGVSVFDFVMPRLNPTDPAKAKVDFVGYARIPALRDPNALLATTDATPEPSEPAVSEADSVTNSTTKYIYTSKSPSVKSAANTASSMHKKSPSGSAKAGSTPKPKKPDTTPEPPPSMHKKSAETKSETTKPSKTGGFVPRKATPSTEDTDSKPAATTPKPKKPKSSTPTPSSKKKKSSG